MDKLPNLVNRQIPFSDALNSEELNNPLLKQIANLYNQYRESGLALQPCGCSNYSKGSHTKYSKGGSGCYVTTACLDALNLPKESLELVAMKVLTREHILKSFSGKKDYLSYQKKGPAIVSAISTQKDPGSIWERVYEQLQNVTQSVLDGNYVRGHQQYKDLILGLEAQFV